MANLRQKLIGFLYRVLEVPRLSVSLRDRAVSTRVISELSAGCETQRAVDILGLRLCLKCVQRY